jgi:large subunit ribosomal protein L24
LALDFDARDLGGVNTILARYMPQFADRLAVVAPVLAPAKLHAMLKLDNHAAGNSAALSVNGNAGITKVSLNAEGVADIASLSVSSFRLLGQIDAADARALAKLTGVDNVVAIGNEPAMLRLTLSGNPFRDMTLTSTLSTSALAATASGTMKIVPGGWPAGTLNLNVARADFGPLRLDGGKLPVAFAGRVTSDGQQATFEDISAVIAGSKVRGKVSASLAMPSKIEGTLDIDTLDVGGLIAVAAGLPKGAEDWAWSSAPFDGGMQQAVTGRLSLNAMRAELTPAITARQFRGQLVLAGDEVALDNVSGTVAGGEMTGKIAFKTGLDGLTTRMNVSVSNSDVAALLPAAARPPVSGRVSAQLHLEGSGRSPATLVGSLHGEGKITLADGQFAGLDPRAFAAVVRAVDQGLPVDAAKIENLAGRALASGQLNVRSAEGKLAVGAGQIRLTDAKASGEGADLAMSGVFDLTNGTLNARLVLAGVDTAAGARPDIFVALNGPVGATSKTLDVSGLTGWLTLRAIDQQSRKLEAIEAEPKEPKQEPKPAPSQPKPEVKTEPTPTAPAPIMTPEKPKESSAPRQSRAAEAPPRTAPQAQRAPVQQAPSLPPPINILPRINPPPAR